MTRRNRLAALQDRNVNLALVRKRRGLTWAHLSRRQQALYRAFLDTLMGTPSRDASDVARADTDVNSPDTDGLAAPRTALEDER